MLAELPVAIASKRNSPALGPGFRSVANSIVSLDRVSKRKRSSRYDGHGGIFEYHDELVPQAVEFIAR